MVFDSQYLDAQEYPLCNRLALLGVRFSDDGSGWPCAGWGAVDANQAEVDGDAINAGAGDREGGACRGEERAEEEYRVFAGLKFHRCHPWFTLRSVIYDLFSQRQSKVTNQLHFNFVH